MTPPLLSIVTISKADVEGLKSTLQSTTICKTSFQIEQIVVDGDGAAETLALTTNCYWVRQVGTGIADAFNEGLAAARGEWVWFLNGGDRIHPDLDFTWLFKLLTVTKADIVTAGLHYDGKLEFSPVPPLRVQWPPLSCWLAHPATIVRRSALVQAGGFDPNWMIAMDFDLWMRLLIRDSRVDVISVPLAAFDVSGVCQRPEMRPTVQRENARILLRYSHSLIRIWLGMGRRLFFTLAKAVWECCRWG